ncbi:hypothetical protein [Pseudoalteromonas ruthenica]|uniref:hypothetical protein n=1 Tax=Pseudoalteromonas ruthenica TaxID=151081 RepID=UPI00110BCC80|nr:hypothetical protein [Pseudoalteromonas ruthenica]TMO90278.1 hypothetical protein CWC12_00410 [Pseudoalteromonas ruthenica]TMP23650.1 hypothetical protein CWC06_10445 [Pseudoalteromonas ruthenica]
MRFLLLIIPFSFSLCAEESGVIPKSINFVSTHWVQGKGTFRVISFNSEYEPCFIIENYEGGLHAGLTSSNKVCSVSVPSNEVVNINHDRSGGSWFEDFEWVDDGLSFAFDSAKGKFNCIAGLPISIGDLPQCMEK